MAPGSEVAALVDLVARDHAARDFPRRWVRDLSRCLHQLGDVEPAAALLRVAGGPDAPRQWRIRLASLEAQLGNVPAAISIMESLRQRPSPADALRLAELYEMIGQWKDARYLLAEFVARRPRNATGHRLLGRAAASLVRWGGAVQPGVRGRVDFSSDPDAAAAARDAMENAVALRPHDARWRAALAEARESAGDLDGAIAAYEDSVRAAEDATERWALGAKQRWQFHLERCRTRLGSPRVEDPLFSVTVAPAGEQVVGVREVPGLFMAELGYAGLTISGFVLVPDGRVDVMLGDSLLRSVNVDHASALPQFTVLIKRTALARFPSAATVSVHTPDGRRLHAPHGFGHLDLAVPHGDGSLSAILETGRTLTKKGEIAPSRAEVQEHQDRDLQIYDQAREFFETRLGRSLFLLYGTLLGYHRDGDLIPTDDDFDAGFVCDATDPAGVKDETKQIVIELIQAGFTVSFNRRGRLFRVQLDRAGRQHIDVHPVWFQDGKVWMHNVVCLPLTRAQFLPAATGKLRGVTVAIPLQPEAFLAANYGPGWRVPDPGFRYYPSALAPEVRRNLARALLTVGEYKELAHRVEQVTTGNAAAGRLVSIGSQDLYPLDQFIA